MTPGSRQLPSAALAAAQVHVTTCQIARDPRFMRAKARVQACEDVGGAGGWLAARWVLRAGGLMRCGIWG
jgi:hypothetical protein